MRLLMLTLLLFCGACVARQSVHRGVVVAGADTDEVVETPSEPPRRLYEVYSDGEFVAVVEGEEQEDGTFEIFVESPLRPGARVEVVRHVGVKTPDGDAEETGADAIRKRLLRFKIEPEETTGK